MVSGQTWLFFLFFVLGLCKVSNSVCEKNLWCLVLPLKNSIRSRLQATCHSLNTLKLEHGAPKTNKRQLLICGIKSYLTALWALRMARVRAPIFWIFCSTLFLSYFIMNGTWQYDSLLVLHQMVAKLIHLLGTSVNLPQRIATRPRWLPNSCKRFQFSSLGRNSFSTRVNSIVSIPLELDAGRVY